MDIERYILDFGCPVYVTDETSRILAANEAAGRIFGCEAREMIGKECKGVVCGEEGTGAHAGCLVEEGEKGIKPIHYVEREVNLPGGAGFPAGFCVLVLPGPAPGKLRVVHIVTPRMPEGGFGLSMALPAGILSCAAGSPEAEEQQRVRSLTPRQTEVLRLLANGMSRAEIADVFHISPATVGNHIQNLYRKLEVHTELEAVALAYRHGVT
jgi:PAS domain S-box-containing protein